VVVGDVGVVDALVDALVVASALRSSTISVARLPSTIVGAAASLSRTIMFSHATRAAAALALLSFSYSPGMYSTLRHSLLMFGGPLRDIVVVVVVVGVVVGVVGVVVVVVGVGFVVVHTNKRGCCCRVAPCDSVPGRG
jgi:hypothetical protein